VALNYCHRAPPKLMAETPPHSVPYSFCAFAERDTNLLPILDVFSDFLWAVIVRARSRHAAMNRSIIALAAALAASPTQAAQDDYAAGLAAERAKVEAERARTEKAIAAFWLWRSGSTRWRPINVGLGGDVWSAEVSQWAKRLTTNASSSGQPGTTMYPSACS